MSAEQERGKGSGFDGFLERWLLISFYGITTRKTRGRRAYGHVTLDDLRRIQITYNMGLNVPEPSEEKAGEDTPGNVPHVPQEPPTAFTQPWMDVIRARGALGVRRACAQAGQSELRRYLIQLGLSDDATDAQAIVYWHGLEGKQRWVADALAGSTSAKDSAKELDAQTVRLMQEEAAKSILLAQKEGC